MDSNHLIRPMWFTSELRMNEVNEIYLFIFFSGLIPVRDGVFDLFLRMKIQSGNMWPWQCVAWVWQIKWLVSQKVTKSHKKWHITASESVSDVVTDFAWSRGRGTILNIGVAILASFVSELLGQVSIIIIVFSSYVNKVILINDSLLSSPS